MKSLFVNTEGGKVGAADGLNLFFGALLGANLGTLDRLAIGDYIQLTILLAGTVMALRMFATSERRIYMLVVLGFYALLLGAVATVPKLRPAGLAEGDLHRLLATLAIWVTFVIAAELLPTRNAARPEASAGEPS
jgi:hypothetical protein